MNQIIKEDIKYIIHTDLGINWELLKNSKILITGANGFLPAYMVETLLFLNSENSYNIDIYCLVRNILKAKSRFIDYIENEKLHFIVQDVCEPIQQNVNFDYIIHAASQASPKYYGKDPVGTLKANTIGTYNMLNLAIQCKAKSFLYFSSSEVYGNINKDYINETDFGYIDCNKTRSCYAESKRMGETMCRSWNEQFNLNTKIVRPFHTYGPGMDLHDGRVFADFVNSIVNKKDIVLNSDGTSKRAFCYLRDATIAFFLILLKGKPGEAYNMGNPDTETSIIDLALLLARMYKERMIQVKRADNPISKGYLQSDVKRNLPDVKKLMELGWHYTTSMEEGFSKTIAYYKKQQG